jgi:hypothetical protein
LSGGEENSGLDEKSVEESRKVKEMSAQLSMIGVEGEELRWLKTLVWLLRHPDPRVPELARQAMLYLTGAAENRIQQKN